MRRSLLVVSHFFTLVGLMAPATAQNANQPTFFYIPWTKLCPTGQNGKQVCVVGKEARLETGAVVLAAALFEPAGGANKILRITLPSGMNLQAGTRISSLIAAVRLRHPT